MAMTDPVVGWPILNPNTPLAFFSPDLARQIETDKYVSVGCLAALIWDFLSHVLEDLCVIRRKGFKAPVVAYVVSRLSTLAWILYWVILSTTPAFEDCPTAVKACSSIYVVAVTSTCLLFALRVRAVYQGDKWVTLIFSILLLGVFGGAVVVPRGIPAINLGSTKYCVIQNLERVTAISVFLTFAHDTSAFVAISWRIVKLHGVEGGISKRRLISGEYLPSFSKGIFQDGQIYYLTVTTFNAVVVAMIYAPVPSPFKTFFALSNLLMMNMMASRVFRKTILQDLPLQALKDSNSMTMAPMEFRHTNSDTSFTGQPVDGLGRSTSHLVVENRPIERRRIVDGENVSGSSGDQAVGGIV